MNHLEEAINEYLKRNPLGTKEERKRLKKLAGISESKVAEGTQKAIDEFKKVIESIKKDLDGRDK